MNKSNLILLSALIVLGISGLVLAEVNGATTVTPGASTRATTTTPANHSAIAGNVTELNITGESITQSWQGYYGNTSGTITLENSAGNTLYNWSLASPQGEVYASNASSVSWSNVVCYNVSGDNATNLESFYGVGPIDVDGVNETFSNATAHDAFSVGSVSFATDACYATFVFDDTGAGVNNHFEEVLLSDSATPGSKPIFAALLEQNVAGFDLASHDFEMLVLENGHAGDTSTTPYFFYLELN